VAVCVLLGFFFSILLFALRLHPSFCSSATETVVCVGFYRVRGVYSAKRRRWSVTIINQVTGIIV